MHKERRKELDRLERQNKPEQVRARQRRYRERHPERPRQEKPYAERKEYYRKRYQDKKAQIREQHKAYYQTNKPKIAAYRKRRGAEKRPELRRYKSQWERDNRDKCRAHWMARAARKRRAMPPWANTEDIKQVYAKAETMRRETGFEHHVDHIIPLRHPLVCGLHWEGNLQVLTRTANQEKGNKFEPYFETRKQDTSQMELVA